MVLTLFKLYVNICGYGGRGGGGLGKGVWVRVGGVSWRSCTSWGPQSRWVQHVQYLQILIMFFCMYTFQLWICWGGLYLFELQCVYSYFYVIKYVLLVLHDPRASSHEGHRCSRASGFLVVRCIVCKVIRASVSGSSVSSRHQVSEASGSFVPWMTGSRCSHELQDPWVIYIFLFLCN